ncbi:hypothetical protein EAH_00046310, partial [Eimeria acervulina]
MKRLLPLLLHLAAAAAPAAAAAAGATAAEAVDESHSVRTPEQQTCSAYSWLEQEISYLRNPPASAAAAPAAAAAAAADSTEALDENEPGDYVELSEEALQLALRKRPTALVLLADPRTALVLLADP